MSRKEDLRKKFDQLGQDEQGNYIYTGSLYAVSDRGKLAAAAAVMLLLAASVIGSGCIDAEVAHGSFYVIIPYIGEVSALFVLLWNMVKLLAAPGGVRSYVLDKAGENVPAASRVLSAFASAGLVLSIIYIVRSGTGEMPVQTVLYPALKLADLLLSMRMDTMFRKLDWQIIK